MSIRLMSDVWDADLGLDPTSLLVLLSLADQANDEGMCWPSVATTARRTGVDVRTVQRHLAALTERGLVTRSERAGRSSLLHVTIARTPAAGGDSDVTPDTRVVGGGDTRVVGGVTPASPRTVREPSGEPSQRQAADLVLVSETDDALVFASSPSMDEAFAAFWQVYPRKVGKRQAYAAWQRAVKRASVNLVLAGAKAYAADPNRTPTYTAHPTTWLNRDGWLDERLPQRASTDRASSAARGYAALASAAFDQHAIEGGQP